MKSLAILLFFFPLLLAAPAEAQVYRRLVNFEWEPIDGASSYELEIRLVPADGDKAKAKLYQFKQNKAAWNGRLTPGQYTMRIRALDYRKVPGEWSEESAFEVALEAAKLVFPPSQAKLVGKDAKEEEVEFKWEPVGGAQAYRFEISAAEGFREEHTIKDTKIRLKVPVAQAFTWKVEGLGQGDIKSEAIAMSEFSVLGPRLPAPVVKKPENDFVREISWEKAEFAKSYDVAITRLNPNDRKWEKVVVFENVESVTLPFNAEWPGGTYRVQVKAKSDRRLDSPLTSATFKVRSGDRSPASEFTHEIRKSIDRINGWYGIASYLITQVTYSSSVWDGQVGRVTSYQAIGGTGRMGVGYFREESPWGFLSIVDLSGFVSSDNKNLTYLSAEANGVWRRNVGERGEFRSQMGLYYKEHQVAQSQGLETRVSSYEKVSVLGPHLSGEYWHSITPKLGFQVNAHLYYSLFKMSSPNGQDISPTPSMQYGLMGSYRFNPRFTGLVGYTLREDRIRYKSTPTNAANIGKINEATLEGHYLNFFAEYSF